jgi:hypothetical protein
VNEKGVKIPGNSWCPTYVAERGPAWEKAVGPLVTDAIRTAGADGFMLDYEGTAAEGYNACNVCFCFRCQAAFAKSLGDEQCALDWPKDVRPEGKFHEKWLRFRCEQGALYVKNIADLAREGDPKARTYTWSGGYYKPYPSHIIYSQACSDITKFASYLTAPTVGTYIYPNDPAKVFAPNAEFGADPKNYGRSMPDMISIIRWTAEVLKPQPVIPCVSGGHTPGGTATPLAGVDLLTYQVANHLLDGARGVDLWGTGPFEDGRYLALIAGLADLFAQAEPYLGAPAAPLSGCETDAQRWRAGAFESGAGRLIVVLNGDDCARKFQVPLRAGKAEVSLPPFGVHLVAEKHK